MRVAGFRVVLLSLALCFPSLSKLAAEEAATPGTYRRIAITQARFGDRERRRQLEAVRTLRDAINALIAGQGRVAQAMQDRFVQYVENHGSRRKDPVAIHLVGLPGIGKSAILDVVEKVGLKVVRVDAQRFSQPDYVAEFRRVLFELSADQKKIPVVLMVDELDKMPEIVRIGGQEQEVTNPLIGILNQILTDGRVNAGDGARDVIDLSNILVVTTMNFAPEEIQKFLNEVMQTKKSYYDFTIEDFQRFDEWVRSTSSAIPKLLSHLFRSNTVSRLAPNTVIVKPLTEEDYRLVVRINADKTIAETTGGTNAKKRIWATYSPAFLDFLYRRTVNAPLGARETVYKVDGLVSQLVYFGTKVTFKGDKSLDRPRRLHLDVDADKAVVRVTPLAQHGNQLVPGDSFSVTVEYDPGSRTFFEPPSVAMYPPASRIRTRREAAQANADTPATRREILDTRFPQDSNAMRGLARRIDQRILGQQPYTRLIEQEFSTYMARQSTGKPQFLGFAGFPGIGKSETVKVAAAEAGFPIARINLQAYASDENQTAQTFFEALMVQVRKARTEAKSGKYIVLLEELDKCFEMNPQTGEYVNRPVMNAIKDLLDTGIIACDGRVPLDLRDAFIFLTMNFTVDRFGFRADPRLTSIEDVIAAWQHLSTRPADRKAVLDSMFAPDTVSRLFDKLHMLRPLRREDYKKLILWQIDDVIKERLHDPETGRDLGAIQIAVTDRYKRYLYKESVIPSEGARNTVVASRRMIARDLERAITKLPKSSPLSRVPLTITLDFYPGSSHTVAWASPQDPKSKEEPLMLFDEKVTLTFPPLRAKGKLPEERLNIAVHEFGHAFVGLRLGRRFGYATSVSPLNGIGGFVGFRQTGLTSGRDAAAEVFVALAARAMERIFLSDTPLEETSSVQMHTGASSDIVQATKALYLFMHQWGMDPQTGIMDRSGNGDRSGYGFFPPIPSDRVDALGRILQQAENFLVAQLVEAHPREWYRDHVLTFARAGGMNEKEFYKMLGFPFPGASGQSPAEQTLLQTIFAGSIQGPDAEVRTAARFRMGARQTTMAENMDESVRFLLSLIRSHFHTVPSVAAARPVGDRPACPDTVARGGD